LNSQYGTTIEIKAQEPDKAVNMFHAMDINFPNIEYMKITYFTFIAGPKKESPSLFLTASLP
jgi:hypothetical protein